MQPPPSQTLRTLESESETLEGAQFKKPKQRQAVNFKFIIINFTNSESNIQGGPLSYHSKANYNSGKQVFVKAKGKSKSDCLVEGHGESEQKVDDLWVVVQLLVDHHGHDAHLGSTAIQLDTKRRQNTQPTWSS